jgi:predicted nucleic acid-binding protein
MTLTDTGPLVALLNRNDPNHAACAAAAKALPSGPLVTTWPCFTEAMYLLYRAAAGYAGQEALWRLVAAGRLMLHTPDDAEVGRMAELMAKYQNVPMDFADASLIAAAEQLGVRRVFTLDRDFYVYRFADGTAAEVVP